MMNPRNLIAAVALVALPAAAARAELIYGLTNNDPSVGQRLVTIESATGAVVSTTLLVAPGSPLQPFSDLDVRPATGQLYGLQPTLTGTSAQLYTINPATGATTAVGGTLPASNLIDFNPVVDRIRLVNGGSFGNQNYRVVPDTGAVAFTDGNLAYAAGDPNAGETPNVRGLGYTNSVPGATSTVLYDIDVDNDALLIQNPPNAGTLNTVGTGLGVNLNAGSFGTFTGFDISGATGVAYLTDGAFAGPSNLYTVNLSTGVASPMGTITGLPAGSTLATIAVAAVPEPTAALAAAAGAALLATRRRRA